MKKRQLTLHGSHSAMGEEDPTQRLAPQQRILKPKLALRIVLLREPEQDTSALKNAMSTARHWILEILID